MRPNISKLFIDAVLDQHRLRVFQKLRAWRQGWYLAGGTSLALQLGHRRSFDFDLFGYKKLVPADRAKVVRVFGDKTRFTLDTDQQLTWITETNVKVTLTYASSRLLHSQIDTDSVPLAAIADIASDKAFVIGRRGEYRDYVDLTFILKKGLGLATITKEARQKYGAMFEEKLFLEQLDYLADLTDFTVEFVGKSLTPKAVKQFLHQQVIDYLTFRKVVP